MTKIINWKTGKTIIEDENLSLIALIEKAVEDDIFLVHAEFRGANFEGANITKDQ